MPADDEQIAFRKMANMDIKSIGAAMRMDSDDRRERPSALWFNA